MKSTRRSAPGQQEKPQAAPSWADVRRWIMRSRDAGNYFLVFRPLYRIMSKLDTLFLQDVVNLWSVSHRVDDDGWFECTTRYLESVGWTRHEQEVRLKSLVRGGWIRLEKRGLPPKRWVFIDVDRLERALDSAEDESPEIPGDRSRQMGGDLLSLRRPLTEVSQSPQGKRVRPKPDDTRPPVAFADTDGAGQRGAPQHGTAAPPGGVQNRTPPAQNGHGIATPRLARRKSRQAQNLRRDHQHTPAPPSVGRGAPQAQNPPPRGTGTARTRPPGDTGGDAPGRSLEKPRNEMDPTNPAAWVSKSRVGPQVPQVTAQDRQDAATLRDHARRHRIPVLGGDANWARPVAVLRRALAKADPEGGAARLSAVLAWYVGWWVPGRKPCIRNGREFKQRWEWISDLYDKVHAREEVPEAPPEVRALVADLAGRGWPKNSDAQLPAVVAQSYANYVSFYRRLRKAVFTKTVNTVERDAVLGACGDPVAYLANWFRAVWRRVKDWPDWSGDLGMFVWRPDHRDFLRAVDTVLTKTTGHSGRWPQLAAALPAS